MRSLSPRTVVVFLTIIIASVTSACSKLVYEHQEGKLSRGTFQFMKEMYYPGQFEEEETPQKRNWAIINDLSDLEAVGALGTRKGLKDDGSYPEYMFRQERSRQGKAAIVYWQKKYKDKFNWQMLFSAERLSYDEKKFLKAFTEARATGKKLEDVLVAEFEGVPVYYSHLKSVMTYSDYNQFAGYNDTALLGGMREVLKSWLEKKIHDRVVKTMNADIGELKRFDHARVANLYLKVKYGKAGKGIYPGSMDKIKLTPMEIYDHFHRMQNAMADVIWVKAAYTVVADENRGEELIAKIDKGGNFAELAAKYAAEPKFIATAKPHIIKGYDRKRGLDEREGRDYYDRLILDMASRDVSKPDPYLGKDGIVIVRFYGVSRSLEKVQLSEVSWKVENDLRTKLLNAVFDEDIKDSRKRLKIVYNDRLLKSLP